MRPQLRDKCTEMANTRGKMQFVDEKFTFGSKFHKIFKIFLTARGKKHKFHKETQKLKVWTISYRSAVIDFLPHLIEIDFKYPKLGDL